MTTPNFVFPPPPPPPPAASSQGSLPSPYRSDHQAHIFNNIHRGRNNNGRGRGAFRSRADSFRDLRGGRNHAGHDRHPGTNEQQLGCSGGYDRQPRHGISGGGYPVANLLQASHAQFLQRDQDGYTSQRNTELSQNPSIANNAVFLSHNAKDTYHYRSPSQLSRESTHPPVRPSFYTLGHGQKRLHGEAFGLPRTTNLGPPAQPITFAVGALIPGKPPTALKETIKSSRRRTHNQLGLTPMTEDHESSQEEDVDEESKLVISRPGNEGLQFSYKGQLATLKSDSEIAAWIAERKKRFPTKQRAEEAAIRKAKLRDAERLVAELRKQELRKKQMEVENRRKDIDGTVKAKQKAEKLRKLYERAQEKVTQMERLASGLHSAEQKMQQGLPVSQLTTGMRANDIDADINISKKEEVEQYGPAEDSTITPEYECTNSQVTSKSTQVAYAATSKAFPTTGETPFRSGLQTDSELRIDQIYDEHITVLKQTCASTGPVDLDSQSFSDISLSDDNDTSSSGSSSEGVGPAETSSKQRGIGHFMPEKSTKQRAICNEFLQKGRCPRGNECQYRHELPERGTGSMHFAKQKNQGWDSGSREIRGERLSLYQRMLAEQKEKEDELILQLVIFLGEQGAFDGPASESVPRSTRQPILARVAPDQETIVMSTRKGPRYNEESEHG